MSKELHVFHNPRDGFMVKGPKGELQKVASQAAVRRCAAEFGVPESEIDWRGCRDLLPEEDPAPSAT